jgi:hypothetical protein
MGTAAVKATAMPAAKVTGTAMGTVAAMVPVPALAMVALAAAAVPETAVDLVAATATAEKAMARAPIDLDA